MSEDETRWLALALPERAATWLELTPSTWGGLEYFALAPRGRGRSALVHVAPPTARRMLDRARALVAERGRRGRRRVPPGDRIQLLRAIARLETALLLHEVGPNPLTVGVPYDR